MTHFSFCSQHKTFFIWERFFLSRKPLNFLCTLYPFPFGSENSLVYNFAACEVHKSCERLWNFTQEKTTKIPKLQPHSLSWPLQFLARHAPPSTCRNFPRKKRKKAPLTRTRLFSFIPPQNQNNRTHKHKGAYAAGANSLTLSQRVREQRAPEENWESGNFSSWSRKQQEEVRVWSARDRKIQSLSVGRAVWTLSSGGELSNFRLTFWVSAWSRVVFCFENKKIGERETNGEMFVLVGALVLVCREVGFAQWKRRKIVNFPLIGQLGWCDFDSGLCKWAVSRSQAVV